MFFFSVEPQRSPSGDDGDGADAGVYDAVFEWLWEWGRPLCLHLWKVHELRATGIQSAVLGVLVLASDIVWMAGVTDWSLGQTSTQEANW